MSGFSFVRTFIRSLTLGATSSPYVHPSVRPSVPAQRLLSLHPKEPQSSASVFKSEAPSFSKALGSPHARCGVIRFARRVIPTKRTYFIDDDDDDADVLPPTLDTARNLPEADDDVGTPIHLSSRQFFCSLNIIIIVVIMLTVMRSGAGELQQYIRNHAGEFRSIHGEKISDCSR